MTADHPTPAEALPVISLLAAGPTHYDSNGKPNTEYAVRVDGEVVGLIVCTPAQRFAFARRDAALADLRRSAASWEKSAREWERNADDWREKAERQAPVIEAARAWRTRLGRGRCP